MKFFIHVQLVAHDPIHAICVPILPNNNFPSALFHIQSPNTLVNAQTPRPDATWYLAKKASLRGLARNERIALTRRWRRTLQGVLAGVAL